MEVLLKNTQVSFARKHEALALEDLANLTRDDLDVLGRFRDMRRDLDGGTPSLEFLEGLRWDEAQLAGDGCEGVHAAPGGIVILNAFFISTSSASRLKAVQRMRASSGQLRSVWTGRPKKEDCDGACIEWWVSQSQR